MRFSVLLSCGVLAVATWGVARAEEPAPPPAAPAVDDAPDLALTAEEIAALRRRIGDWDALDPAARARIAKNVRRLREMSEDDRRRVLERARRLDRADPVTRTQFPDRLHQFAKLSGEQKGRAREDRLLVRATSQAIARELSEEARRTIDALPPSERRDVEICAMALWRHAAIDRVVAAGLEPAEPSADAPPALRQRFEQARADLRARGDLRPREAARRLAALVVEDRVGVRLREVLRAHRMPREQGARVARLGEALRAEFPDAFRAATDAVAAAAARGREGLAGLCHAQAPGRFVSTRARALFEVFWAVELRRPLLAETSPEVLAQADALGAQLLAALGIPAADVARVVAARSPEERRDVLQRLPALRRFLPTK